MQMYWLSCLRNMKKVTETQNAFKDELVWRVLSVCCEHPRSFGFLKLGEKNEQPYATA